MDDNQQKTEDALLADDSDDILNSSGEGGHKKSGSAKEDLDDEDELLLLSPSTKEMKPAEKTKTVETVQHSKGGCGVADKSDVEILDDDLDDSTNSNSMDVMEIDDSLADTSKSQIEILDDDIDVQSATSSKFTHKHPILGHTVTITRDDSKTSRKNTKIINDSTSSSAVEIIDDNERPKRKESADSVVEILDNSKSVGKMIAKSRPDASSEVEVIDADEDDYEDYPLITGIKLGSKTQTGKPRISTTKKAPRSADVEVIDDDDDLEILDGSEMDDDEEEYSEEGESDESMENSFMDGKISIYWSNGSLLVWNAEGKYKCFIYFQIYVFLRLS